MADKSQVRAVQRVAHRFLDPDSSNDEQIADRYAHPDESTFLDSSLSACWLEALRSSADRHKSSLRGRLHQAVCP